MVAALAQFGLDANMPVVPLTIDAPLQERLAYAEMCEAGIGAVLDAFASGVPDADGVTTTTTTITGEDGNDVTLYISRPDVDGPLPAIVHLHGGGPDGLAVGSGHGKFERASSQTRINRGHRLRGCFGCGLRG